MAMTIEAGGARHTPGPWRREMEEIYATIDYNDYLIADATGDTDLEIEEAEANANLIAAAPELLAALKALMPKGWDHDDTMDHIPGVKLARLAIAKAEGKP
jgi:hypothetical protein